MQPVTPLKVVPANSALRLRAILDFEDSESGSKRTAGDEWLFEGPGKKSVVFIYLFIFSYSLSFAGNLGQLKHLHEHATNIYWSMQHFGVSRRWCGCRCVEFLMCAQMLMHRNSTLGKKYIKSAVNRVDFFVGVGRVCD